MIHLAIVLEPLAITSVFLSNKGAGNLNAPTCAVWCDIKRLRQAEYFIRQNFGTGWSHGNAITKMPTIQIQVIQLRMPPDGWNIAGGSGAQPSPVLYQWHSPQGWQ